MPDLIKHSGQVFTPDYLVNLILDEAGYYGADILRKHCIDNSCGDGAFLCAIVARYISAYIDAKMDLNNLQQELYTYIHGIELDPVAYNNCLDNLRETCRSIGVDCAKFDIANANTLACADFDGKMDYVIGNPPYVRVHNLDKSYDAVKSYSFANGGMTDLYLVFFEKGFRMLKEGGKLCYITPSSWLNSVAGGVMRDYVRSHRTLVSLIDLEHFQPFKATTYTLIALFEKGDKRNNFAYHIFSPDTLGKEYIAELSFNEIDINSCFYLSNHETLVSLKETLTSSSPKYISAKNGFATLADKVFITSEFPFEEFVIPTIKASTGKWYKAFFPYNTNGKPFSKERIFGNTQVAEYLEANKTDLLKDATPQDNPFWYLFGRTQALKDVAVNKLAINTTIKDVKSIKLNLVPAGSGIYSGLYILTDFDFAVIEEILRSENFVNYISSLKKYKSGGYYTYNSKDLEAFLNHKIQKLIDNGKIQSPIITHCGMQGIILVLLSSHKYKLSDTAAIFNDYDQFIENVFNMPQSI